MLITWAACQIHHWPWFNGLNPFKNIPSQLTAIVSLSIFKKEQKLMLSNLPIFSCNAVEAPQQVYILSLCLCERQVHRGHQSHITPCVLVVTWNRWTVNGSSTCFLLRVFLWGQSIFKWNQLHYITTTACALTYLQITYFINVTSTFCSLRFNPW